MKKKKLLMGAALAAFFLAILFPVWGLVFPQPKEEALDENRAMTEWSFSGSLRDRIETLENFLNDHLAFRQTIISAVLRTNLALGESPHSSVLAGFDGWLFYVEDDEDFRRGTGLDEASLREVYDIQQKAADTFAAAGVDYRVLIAPDKHSVYPQYLPLSSRLGSGAWILQQMMTPPGPEYTVRFVDAASAIVAAAETGDRQYYKTDTHWNPNGAYTAYLALMDDLEKDHPTLHRLTEDELTRVEVSNSGDLAAMIGQQGIMGDRTPLVTVRNPAAREDPERSDSSLTAYINESHPEAPRILLIHDSFGPSLATFLKESASELYLMSNDSPTFSAIGDLSRFDIVIFEVVERNRSWLWGGITDVAGGGEYYEEEGEPEDSGEDDGGYEEEDDGYEEDEEAYEEE